MTGSISVTSEGERVHVQTPYDPAFTPPARALGGRWNPARRVWAFDQRDEAAVRELVTKIFGTDGAEDAGGGVVTVRLPVTDNGPRGTAEFRAAGRRLAWRPGRDMPVRLAPGVVVVEGGFGSRGGSMKNPALAERDGTLVEVRDVPLSQAQLMIEQVGGYVVSGSAEVRAALLAERARLAARLAEIDRELADLG